MKIDFDYDIGEEVYDDLTHKKAVLIGIQYQIGTNLESAFNAAGCVGYWLNNNYLGGGRHPWEITKIKE